jgi:peptidoglycan/xylan/chitin deacetylase (PgdA/CDA1 family)
MPAGAPPASVYLTFDDGPNPTATPLLLDALRRERASATFFIIDDHVTTETAPIVRRMFDEGHSVGLHSNERWRMLGTPRGIADAMRESADRIEQLSGVRPCRWFRPHAGWRSAAMYAALEQLDYRLAGWSWGLWDWHWWKARDADSIAQRLGSRAQAGDILVIHDGHHRNPRADRQYAVEAAPRLIATLRARHLEPARLPC